MNWDPVTHGTLRWMPILGADSFYDRAGDLHGYLGGNLIRRVMV
jgi:hypothetical protein